MNIRNPSLAEMNQFYSATHGKPKLLVVDDQPVHIQVIYQIFAEDYQIFMATNGARALEICALNPPDLVLLDIVMPEMDGYQVCTQLKADAATAHIPVIFLTAEHDSNMETYGLELGAVDFITKPINPAVVRARVKTHMHLKLQADIMRNMVYLDGLTGVFNRRYFDQQLPVELARAQRARTAFSLIMLDIDFFKRYNDLYGHQAGDDCLRQVAVALKNGLKRVTDILARYGGEEFVCLLPDTDLEGALYIANMLEQTVRELGITHQGSDVAPCITISLGVASQAAEQRVEPATIIARADEQLYQAKLTGRRRVCGVSLPSSDSISQSLSYSLSQSLTQV